MIYTVHPGENVKTSLLAAGCIFPCGGGSLCGKCKIKVLSGSVPVTDADRLFLSEKELDAGFRLACMIDTPSEELVLEDSPEKGGSSDFFIPSDFSGKEGNILSDFCFAIDIGTTTIAIALVNSEGRMVDVFTCTNSQRRFGTDVVSRIVASNNGYGPAMRDAVIRDIDAGVNALLERNGLTDKMPSKIVIVGNTVMQHIFAGYSCEGLGMAPFNPVSIDRTETVSGVLMPGISAYVGADLVAGIAASGMSEDSRISLLIDLGTNGELALGNCERILVASTAAGPAFEGGNISCGCGSVAGAVSRVRLSDDDNEEPVRLTLIGTGCTHSEKGISISTDKAETVSCEQQLVYSQSDNDIKIPGLCGTGVISLAAELLRQGLADEHGTFDERLGSRIKLVKDGSVTFTQKDMRELQLAKAAIRSGIDTLMRNFGVGYEDIAKVYIAGGFGTELSAEDAAEIGLLPRKLVPVSQAIGNAALKGAVKYLTNDVSDQICSKCTEIVLADDEYFNRVFIENADFHCF